MPPPAPSRDTNADTLAVFGPARRYEPLTTPEVAAAFDCNRRTVYKRFQTLVNRGQLETKAVRSNIRIC